MLQLEFGVDRQRFERREQGLEPWLFYGKRIGIRRRDGRLCVCLVDLQRVSHMFQTRQL